MITRYTFLAVAMVLVLPAAAEQSYESARSALYEEFFSNDGATADALVGYLFTEDILVHDLCEVMAETAPEQSADCNVEPQLTISGISKKGRDVLISAAREYQSFQLDVADERARQIGSFCETGVSSPTIIASVVSDIEDSISAMQSGYYYRVVEELDGSDVSSIETLNLSTFGVRRPEPNGSLRKIEQQLAAQYPAEYQQEHLENCTEALLNKGKPHKWFQRDASRDNCSWRSNSIGPDGQHVASTTISMSEGCGILRYIAQSPEREGDYEVRDVATPRH